MAFGDDAGSNDEYCKVVVDAYTAAVACACRGCQTSTALSLLEDVVDGGWLSHGPILDLRVHCQVLMGCRYCMEYDKVGMVKESMREMVRRDNQVFYRGVVHLGSLEGLMEQGSDVSFALLQCMVNDGLPPDSLSYGLALESCGLEGRYDRIILLYEMMKACEDEVQLGRAAPWKPLEPWEQMGNGEKEVVSRVLEALEVCGGPGVERLSDLVYEEVCDAGMFEHWIQEGGGEGGSDGESNDSVMMMIDLHHLTTPLARAALRHVYEDALGRQSEYCTDGKCS